MKPRNDKYLEIVKLYPDFSDKEISKKTGKSIATIRTVAVANNLHKKKYYWSEKEDQFLKKYYDEYGSYHCAEILKRSVNGVIGRWRKIK